MTTPNPITPPPELVQQWFDDARNAWAEPQHYVAAQAAQWGADQELDKSNNWLVLNGYGEAPAPPHHPPPQAAELEGAGAGAIR